MKVYEKVENFDNSDTVSSQLIYKSFDSGHYPKSLSSIVALYCGGISMRAESANSVSFRD